ncbi:MAG: FeoA domain-containing protein [Lentisphaerae bacterium]|nr:FeoA domain-containing protein [Lentisphaerota bacterium]
MNVGETGKIAGYAGDDKAYRHKLLRMGLVKGAGFQLVRKAPMGDPVEIELRGFKLTLRKAEAEGLDVEVLTG